MHTKKFMQNVHDKIGQMNIPKDSSEDNKSFQKRLESHKFGKGGAST